MKPCLLGLVMATATICPLSAQSQPSVAPAAATAPAATRPAPASQAPDEVMVRLSDLVHAGKYQEAQQLTAGLLLAYPDDQRLLKDKAWLDKAGAAAKPVDVAAPGGAPPASSAAQPAVPIPSAQLYGTNQVDYAALLDLVRQAQQTADLVQQKSLLKQFMAERGSFLGKHPDQTKLWELRAVCALGLDDIAVGSEAGQKLLAAGAADSNDPNLQQLMAQLKNKGWLDEPTAKEAIAAKTKTISYTTGKNHTVTLPTAAALDLIWIAPGTFTMGSPDSETGRDRDEGPQTAVTISQGFWLGKTPVTQGQYQAIMDNNPSSFTNAGANHIYIGPDAPVEQVSWDDAMEFCRKLTEQERAAGHLPEGYAYTLPSEAQWEYACRAGTTGARYGNLDDIAWYGDNSGNTTHPVAKKQPNAWGLYDMLGNVSEWCLDWYGTYPGGKVTDPVGADSGSSRVFRGGSWFDPAFYCRSAFRWGGSGGRDGYFGFRLALSSVLLDQAVALAKPAEIAAPGGSPPASSVVQPAVTATSTQPDVTTRGQNHTVTLPTAVTLDLIWIAPGTFTMGSPDSETGRDKDEGPQTAVTISQGFWLGKTPVTQGQYQAIMDNNPSNFAKVGPDAPVEQVSWDDAMEFCRKLTEQERAAGHLPEGYAYTLPTEAQWEYACRAGTTEAQYGILDDIAWYSGNSGHTTHPVAQKQPNAWGLYDMLGNVSEWCSDWNGPYPSGNVTDPVGAAFGSSRVFRGGCWSYFAYYCRSACRGGDGPGVSFSGLGFRVALSSVRLDKAIALAKPADVAAPGSSPPPANSVIQPAVTATSTQQLEVWASGQNHTVTLPHAVTLDLIWIVPGTFTMGSPDSEVGQSNKRSNERPVHRVTISQGFWLGKTPVTQGQYQAVMGNNPSGFAKVGPDAPVETVSWDDTMEFCRKLTEQEREAGRLPEGYAYTLPTEAQWEYACRAGTTGARYGNLDDIAWYNANSGMTTHPVAQKQPNAWGLYDMLGNVEEWCSDWYVWPYPGRSVTDPVGADAGSNRVIRGGDWLGPAVTCRAAIRFWYNPGYHYSFLGFRLALAPAR